MFCVDTMECLRSLKLTTLKDFNITFKLRRALIPTITVKYVSVL